VAAPPPVCWPGRERLGLLCKHPYKRVELRTFAPCPLAQCRRPHEDRRRRPARAAAWWPNRRC
jgi:hypothetical protein